MDNKVKQADNKAKSGNEEKKEVKKDPYEVVSRKPFVLENIDKTSDKQKDFAVFTSAKKLSEYIYRVTQNAPVKFRWSLITRMHDACADIVDCLYLANFDKGEQRLEYQKLASVKMRLLNHYAEVCYRLKIFNFKRLRIITERIEYARKVLKGWVKMTMKKDGLDDLLPTAFASKPPMKRKKRVPKLQQLKLDI